MDSPYRTAPRILLPESSKPNWLHRIFCRAGFHDWRVVLVRQEILRDSRGHLIDSGRFLDDLCSVHCDDCGKLLKGAGQSCITLDWPATLYLNVVIQAEELHSTYRYEALMDESKDLILKNFLKKTSDTTKE